VRALLDVSAVPAQPVGAGVYTIAVARGLAERADIDLHLLARQSDGERWPMLVPGAVVHTEVPDRRVLRLAWEQTGAERIARAVNPDVWHGPHYTMPLRSPVPAVVTIHDLTFFDHPEWHERSKVIYFRRMIRAAAKRAAVLICVSEYTAGRLRALCDPQGEVLVIPHGVDHSRFNPNGNVDDDLALLAAHGITPPYLAFAGTIEPRKNLPALVAAFAKVSAAHPEVRLVLAGGDGWGTKATRAAIAESGVATRILRPGYLAGETLVALFRHAAAITYPSLEEGFGLPALEALACGTPLVTSAGTALGEVAGDAALLVSPTDEAALAAALATVLDDPATAARLRAAGPARAAQFTWAASVENHASAYRRAANASMRV
jgi:glycosyltransferase involved in cell wall biosynthesis